jgi:hypothetical protein
VITNFESAADQAPPALPGIIRTLPLIVLALTFIGTSILFGLRYIS